MRKLLKKEAKQVGDIYHVCSPEAMIYNLKHNAITPHKFSVFIGDKEGVSFTRNKNFLVNTTIFSYVVFRITLDGDKLSENYKIKPNDFYNQFSMSDRVSQKMTAVSDEMEEVVIGEIKNLDRYIKNIEFIIKANPALSIQKEKQATLDSLVYIKKHNLPFSSQALTKVSFKRDLDSLISLYTSLVSYIPSEVAKNIKGILNNSFPITQIESSVITLDNKDRVKNYEVYAFPEGVDDLTEDKLTPARKYKDAIVNVTEYLSSILGKAKIVVTDSKYSRQLNTKLNTVLNNRTYFMFSVSVNVALDLEHNEYPNIRISLLNSKYDTKEFYVYFQSFSD